MRKLKIKIVAFILFQAFVAAEVSSAGVMKNNLFAEDCLSPILNIGTNAFQHHFASKGRGKLESSFTAIGKAFKKNQNKIVSAGKTLILPLKGDEAYAINYPEDKTDVFRIRHKAKMMVKLKERGIGIYIPEVIFNPDGGYMHMWKGTEVIAYKGKKEFFSYITDNRQDLEYSERIKFLKKAFLRNINDLTKLFKSGYFHTSLTALTYVHGELKWSMIRELTLENLQRLASSNLRMSGIADLEHVEPLREKYLPYDMAQLVFELGLIISYAGAENNLQGQDTALMFDEGLRLLFQQMEVQGENPVNKDDFAYFAGQLKEYLRTKPNRSFYPYKFQAVMDVAEKTERIFTDNYRKGKAEKWGTAGYEVVEQINDKAMSWPERITYDDKNDTILINDSNGVYRFGMNGKYLGVSNNMPAVKNSQEVRDEEGNIYRINSEDCCLTKFDQLGNVIFAIGKQGKEYADFWNPVKILLDAKRNIYILDKANDRIQKFDKNGEYICVIGNIPGKHVGQFYQPADFTLDEEGNLWVADTLNHRIVKIIPGKLPSWENVQVLGKGINELQELSLITQKRINRSANWECAEQAI